MLSVGGVLNLKNLELNVDEFNRFHLPYLPSFAFIEEVEIVFPLVIGGKLDVKISGILIVLERDSEENQSDPQIVHSALQTWIAAAYLYFTHADSLDGNISSSKVETLQKWLDIASLSVSQVHVRLEEPFSCHVPCQSSETLLCSGFICKLFFQAHLSISVDPAPIP